MAQDSEQVVFEIAQSFANSWNERLASMPMLQLDFTWPSVGVVDLLTSHLRRKQRLTSNDHSLILGASSYIAQIALSCWKTFPGPKQGENQFSLRLSKGAVPDVLLAAEAAAQLKQGERFSIAVNQVLRRILRSNALFFESLPHHIRKFEPSQNYLSSLSLGIVTGLCPYGKGPWSSANWSGIPWSGVESSSTREADFNPQIQSAVRLLAQSAAAYYSRNFPDEPIGHAAELYEAALIFPPSMINEQFPCTRSVELLLRYLAERRFPIEQFPALFSNLSKSPDDFISNVGFICGTALVEDGIPDTLRIVAAAKGPAVAPLRPALLGARSLFGRIADPLDALQINNFQQARQLLFVERELGFVPALTFIDESLSEPWLLKVIESLCCFNPEPAERELEKLSTERPLPSDVMFEAIQLDIMAGRTDRAREALINFRTNVADMSKREEACYLSLLGRLALHEDDLESARDAFAMSYAKVEELIDSGDYSHSGLALVGPAAAGLMANLGQVDEALTMYDSLASRQPWNTAAQLGRTRALLLMGEREQALAHLKGLPVEMFLKRELFQVFLEATELP